MTKSEAVNRMKNDNLSENSGQLRLWKKMLYWCQIICQRLWLNNKASKIVLVKTCWRCLKDILSLTLMFFQDVFKTCLQDVFLMTSWKWLQEVLRKTSWRRLEEFLKTFSKDVLKASWRRIERWNIVTLKTSSRRLYRVLENKKCLLGRYHTKVVESAKTRVNSIMKKIKKGKKNGFWSI